METIDTFSNSDKSNYQPGDIIDVYVLKERLSGNQQLIFRGVDSRDQKTVAIKIFVNSLNNDLAHKAYYNEIWARDLAKSIPGVLRIIDKGIYESSEYFVTEYMETGNLSKVLKQYSDISLQEALSLFSPIADTLDTLHKQGIVHRDIKPENILVRKKDEKWEIFIIDFDDARFFHDPDGAYITDSVAGTPQYIAPEVFTASTTTYLVDNYAFGVMLYTAFEGKLPFTKPRIPFATELETEHVPYPEKTRRNFTKGVADILLWMLSDNATERPESAKQAVDLLWEIANSDDDERKWIGRNFHNYIVTKILYQGRISPSLLAIDIQNKSKVVLKTFDSNSLKNTTAAYENEIQSLSRVEAGHSILIPKETFRQDGVLFIVSDYIAGGSLRTLIHNNNSDPEVLMTIFDQIAEAIDFMHSRGIVHRDIKPENIVYEMAGGVYRAYLTDFGIAKIVESTRDSFSTQYKDGTWLYMAPEVWVKESRKTNAIDIYGFGLTLYEAFEGRVPFTGSEVALLRQHLESPVPSPEKFLRLYGQNAVSILLQPLEKDPNKRPKSAVRFMKKLRKAMKGKDVEIINDGVIQTDPTVYFTEEQNYPDNGRPRRPLRDAVDMLFKAFDNTMLWIHKAIKKEDLSVSAAPSSQEAKLHFLSFRLRSDYKFLSEPIYYNDSNLRFNKSRLARFIGRDDHVVEFGRRLVSSTGGTFLITGYRGVGKTSFVNRVIYELKHGSVDTGSIKIIDVYLSLARPISPTNLMFLVIQNLYERLNEEGVFRKLPKPLQKEIMLSYQRTVTSITHKANQLNEYGVNFSYKDVGMNAKRGGLDEVLENYLPYDDRQAERDIISISRKLISGYKDSESIASKFRRKLLGKPPLQSRMMVLFVLDELDKLNEESVQWGEIQNNSQSQAKPEDRSPLQIQPNEKYTVHRILGALKNLFTASGLTFIFVAGKDLQDDLIEERRRGEGVYESIFAYDLYLPIMKSNANKICLDFIEDQRHQYSTIEDDNKKIRELRARHLEHFFWYLDFFGRGIPRKTLYMFNRHVVVKSTELYLDIDRPSQRRRIRFYSELRTKIENGLAYYRELTDKQNMAVYYLVDWILEHGSRSFTQGDAKEYLLKLNKNLSPDIETNIRLINRIFSLLQEHGYMEKIFDRGNNLGSNSSISTRYIVSPRCIREKGLREYDNNALDGELEKEFGQYRLLNLVSTTNGVECYRTWDNQFQREVLIRRTRLENRQYLEQNEMLIGMVNHPNVAKYFGHGEANGYAYVALEYIDGVSLENIFPLSFATFNSDELGHWRVTLIFQAIVDTLMDLQTRYGITFKSLSLSEITLTFGGGRVAFQNLSGAERHEVVELSNSNYQEDIVNLLGSVFFTMMHGTKIPVSLENLDPEMPPEVKTVLEKCLSAAEQFNSLEELQRVLNTDVVENIDKSLNLSNLIYDISKVYQAEQLVTKEGPLLPYETQLPDRDDAQKIINGRNATQRILRF